MCHRGYCSLLRSLFGIYTAFSVSRSEIYLGKLSDVSKRAAGSSSDWITKVSHLLKACRWVMTSACRKVRAFFGRMPHTGLQSLHSPAGITSPGRRNRKFGPSWGITSTAAGTGCVFAHQAGKDVEAQHRPTSTNLYHVSTHVPKREQDYAVTTTCINKWFFLYGAERMM